MHSAKSECCLFLEICSEGAHVKFEDLNIVKDTHNSVDFGAMLFSVGQVLS